MTFGATDAPLKAKDLDEAGLAQWPMVMGGIVPVAHLDGVKADDLVLDGKTLAKIYLGKIKTWNDPAIAEAQPEREAAATAIAVIHRADGSGTTFNFTDYLSKVSPEWKDQVGEATSVEWPTGIGAKGNDGVANNVAGTEGAIGYVEYAYAKQNNLAWADMINKAGKKVAPTIEAFQAAAANADWANAAGLLSDPHRPARRQVLADDRRDLHPDVQEAGRRRRLQRGAEVLRLVLRQGRRRGQGARLHPDARQRHRDGQEGVGQGHRAEVIFARAGALRAAGAVAKFGQ